MKIKTLLKSITTYAIIIGITFILGEILSRIFFPEFSTNQVHKKISEKQRLSKSQNQFFENLQGLSYRSKVNYKQEFDLDEKTIWLFGDSVTNGYGLKYTDTYYFQLESVLNSIGINYNIIAISGYGSDLEKSIDLIISNKNLFKKDDLIIYQFNYNDIVQPTKKDLIINKKELGFTEQFIKDLKLRTSKFRYAYLNSSNFLKTLQHYAGIYTKKTSGKCDRRGLDALGGYTFAYVTKKFEKQSIEGWNEFSDNLKKMNNITKKLEADFIVLISPISLQVPYHEKNNKLNFDITCATINPYEKIKNILSDLNIKFADPLPLFTEKIEIDINEKNNSRLFHIYDTNHPNANGHLLMAYSLLEKILQ